MRGGALDDVKEILNEASQLGVKLFIEGGRLACQPKPPDFLSQRIRENRDALFKLLISDEKFPDGVGSLEGLRKFAPNLWQLVRIKDGTIGLLWGVHARGIVVSLGPKAGLLTLNPEDVSIL